MAFGDGGLALQAARPLMHRHIPVPERWAALWVETARAYTQQGRLSDGCQALRIAETCAAQDVRRPAVRDLVADMAARDRRHTLPELPNFRPTGSFCVTEPNAPEKKPFLYVVVCACGIAGDLGKLITAAQERNWDVRVVATPAGLGVLDTETIEAQTGYPIRSAWRTPGEARPLPPADAIAVAPATFNTVNKWAAGISDILALGILCEAYGMGILAAVLPYLNSAQAAPRVPPESRPTA